MPFFKSKEEKEARKLAKQAEQEENRRKAEEYYKKGVAEVERKAAETEAKIQRAFVKAGDKAAGVVEKAGEGVKKASYIVADSVEATGTGAAQKIIDFGNAGLDRVYNNFEAYLKTDFPHYYEEISLIEDTNKKRNRMDEIDKEINKFR